MLSMSPLRVMGPLASTVGDMGTWGRAPARKQTLSASPRSERQTAL
jgi:hypothetical protein